MKKPVIMPKIGLDMDEGTVCRWYKKAGEHIDEGEPLLEIETDKATTDVESSISGTLSEILCDEGDTVEITRVIGWIEEDDR